MITLRLWALVMLPDGCHLWGVLGDSNDLPPNSILSTLYEAAGRKDLKCRAWCPQSADDTHLCISSTKQSGAASYILINTNNWNNWSWPLGWMRINKMKLYAYETECCLPVTGSIRISSLQL